MPAVKGRPRPDMKGNSYAKGHHFGRPEEWTDEMIGEEAQHLRKWIDNPKNYYFTAFLNQRELHPEQMERFCQRSKDFREAFTLAKRIQEQRLVEMAISRAGDPGFIKFVLQNKSGWKEKTEHSGDSVNPIAFILNDIDGSSKDLIKE